MARKFNFDLFRLNIVDLIDLFMPDQSSLIRSDEDIVKLLEIACSSEFDKEQETYTAKFKWSLRYFSDYKDLIPDRRMLSAVLARSILEKDGLIVTDDGISEGSSASNPPLASTMIVFFDLKRHLVAVEHSGELSQVSWKDHIEKIFDDVSLSLGKASTIKLEPVPEKHEIIGLFKSFDRITRIKATLRIPNPELTRYTQNLFDDLKASNVREYTQDMKNPGGLSKEENARPFATAVLAQQGYKTGDVQMEGYRNDDFEKVISGSNASRGAINSLKQFVRGLNANAKAKETKKALFEIAKEIDRIHPLDPQADNE
ncbi:hypothetical protein [Marinobacter salexigens]|uniref:Uncharacterized protein n=1 Tax=Marinobacter salexigens TaxID=1925763 RepID=A0ABS6A5J0_9GAMM|nr:hypothetical protein [Marinobacter salexigens]MBU2873465.1 hypothetical protein [Marinobacter salexigens]